VQVALAPPVAEAVVRSRPQVAVEGLPLLPVVAEEAVVLRLGPRVAAGEVVLVQVAAPGSEYLPARAL